MFSGRIWQVTWGIIFSLRARANLSARHFLRGKITLAPPMLWLLGWWSDWWIWSPWSCLVRLRYLPLDFKPIARDQFALMTGKDLFAYVGLQSTEEMKWIGFDFIVDFYKLRFGGELALRDIDPYRLSAYRLLANKVEHREQKTELDQFLFSFCHIFSARLSHLKGEK